MRRLRDLGVQLVPHLRLAHQDDADGDGVPDNVDDCPNRPNPPIIAGTFRQLDTDQDGRGDICDPPETLDDDNNGIPDDAVSFSSVISCSSARWWAVSSPVGT